MIGLVSQLGRLGSRPENEDRFDHNPNGCLLGHNQQSGTRLASRQATAKVIQHGPAVMGYHNAVREGCPVQEFRVADAPKLGIGS